MKNFKPFNNRTENVATCRQPVGREVVTHVSGLGLIDVLNACVAPVLSFWFRFPKSMDGLTTLRLNNP